MKEQFPLNKFPVGAKVVCKSSNFYFYTPLKVYEVVKYSDKVNCIYVDKFGHLTGYDVEWQMVEPKSLDDYM